MEIVSYLRPNKNVWRTICIALALIVCNLVQATKFSIEASMYNFVKIGSDMAIALINIFHPIWMP